MMLITTLTSSSPRVDFLKGGQGRALLSPESWKAKIFITLDHAV